MGKDSFNKPNLSSTDHTPFLEILSLPMSFYFLPTNIMSLSPLLLQFALLLCYFVLFFSLIQFILHAELKKSCWMDCDCPNPTGNLLQDYLSKPWLPWRTTLWHWLGIFATRFHLHLAVQANRASTTLTEVFHSEMQSALHTVLCDEKGIPGPEKNLMEGNTWQHISRLKLTINIITPSLNFSTLDL